MRFSRLYSYFSLPTEVRVRARLATSGEDSRNPAPGNGCGVFLWPWMAGMPEMQEHPGGCAKPARKNHETDDRTRSNTPPARARTRVRYDVARWRAGARLLDDARAEAAHGARAGRSRRRRDRGGLPAGIRRRLRLGARGRGRGARTDHLRPGARPVRRPRGGCARSREWRPLGLVHLPGSQLDALAAQAEHEPRTG